MVYSRSSYSSLPEKPGVYEFLDNDGTVLYVGKAKDLKARVSSYFTNQLLLGEKTRVLVSQIEKIRTHLVDSEIESLLLEAYYIKKYQPKYNVRMTDGKSYPLIRISQNLGPAVLLARQPTDRRSQYFGPYPNAGAVKVVLRTVRRVFPFQSVPNHPKRRCLYNHLGLCPCPPLFTSEDEKRIYKRNIKNITRILEGKSKVIMRELERERDRASKDERFEDAAKLQRQINALSIITQPFHRPIEYDVNPNLRSDLRQMEKDALKETLQTHGLSVDTLDRIECYDISNIQGTNATASMVVLTHGEIDKSHYRKFKIRRENTPNDFAMMAEVIGRRLKHSEWPTPDLIIVDGGKGQISAVLKVLQENHVNIPLIGLAKREETIVVPKISNFKFQISNFLEVSLPKSSPALLLLMRIRDEAHRFAITYHKKRRSMAFLRE